MIKLILLIVLISTVFAESNIDKKIQTNTEKLNSSDDKKETTNIKMDGQGPMRNKPVRSTVWPRCSRRMENG
mgnify:CR=1 FL=1